MNGVIWQSEKLMLYSAPTQTSCSTLHDADSSTHSDWLSVFAVFFPPFSTRQCSTLLVIPFNSVISLRRRQLACNSCQKINPEWSSMSDLQCPVVEDFDLQFTQRSESKVNNTHSAERMIGERADKSVNSAWKNLQHCCGELVSTSYRYSLFYFSAHFFFVFESVKEKITCTTTPTTYAESSRLCFFRLQPFFTQSHRPRKVYLFFLLDDFIFLLLFAHFARVYRYRRRRLREKTI